MFKRLREPRRPVSFEFEGETVASDEGETIAAALLAHGVRQTREAPVSGRPRAAHCLIGVCFECLVDVDGRSNQQACMIPVRAGMKVRRQRRAGGANGGGTS